MTSVTAQRPVTEEAPAAAPEEPPDRRLPSLATPIAVLGHGAAAKSFRVEADRRSALEASTSPTVPYSPCMADSTGGSASDYEHELDSPSSLSSWNSWAGGRRGDLADVEDLELDSMHGGEPELETVSELDEESSSFCSGSDRAGLDSDEDIRQQKHGLGLGFDGSSPRRKTFRSGGQFNDLSHSHHVHHASNQHHYHHPSQHTHHAPPSFPHFSPRAGGHGLSHASRYSLRAPPNLAARRRKGRIAELAEEGAGESINTTVMPKKTGGTRKGKGTAFTRQAIPTEGDSTVEEGEDVPSQTETEADPDDDNSGQSPSTPTLQSSSHSWNDFEFVGPPPIPVRCISPSETVPVVPSPLCVCLNAEEQSNAGEDKAVATAKTVSPPPDSTITSNEEDSTVQAIHRAASPPTPPSPSTSGKSVESFPTVSTPATSPPGSPQLTRKSSRGRRSSSPGRAKPKVPLRPCFRRRASAQVGAVKQLESSSECESEVSQSRGRNKVRFSEAPPTEVRTHSPVEYDRKACPISNRLSPSDVEELRDMNMEMGLLEAKWAAMAACKTETTDEESGGEEKPPYTPPSERKRADSISSSSPSRFCRNRFAKGSSVSPADHLRLEREKERERACRLAGIGTGIGFRYSGASNSCPRQLHHGGTKTPGACNPSSLISRFGLSKPPPPLPGLTSPVKPSFEGGSVLYRPSSAPPIRNDYSATGQAYHDDDGYDDGIRGRSMSKSSSRSLNESTSTDGTVRELSEPSGRSVPELRHTSPSPPSSPGSGPASPLSSRPSIHPHQHPSLGKSSTTPSHSPPLTRLPSSSSCGYDSPASEFYESGSEYDLIG